MKRAEILEEARKCVCGHRKQDYGNPEDNFQLIANFWSDYLSKKSDPQMQFLVTPVDVAMMMALLKIARIKNGGTEDSFVDLAGYAACGGEINDKRKSDRGTEDGEEVCFEEYKGMRPGV